MIPERMLFVYNAESGMFNALNDWAHKFFSPETYECSLCRHTYGLRGMLVPWKIFIEGRPFPSSFHYRPEFWRTYPAMRDLPLPLILVERQGAVEVLLAADEIKGAVDLPALIKLVSAKLDASEKAA
ncbi:MAG: hypothetical protein ABIQ12_11125 [Opitutaceae bacterium]